MKKLCLPLVLSFLSCYIVQAQEVKETDYLLRTRFNVKNVGINQNPFENRQFTAIRADLNKKVENRNFYYGLLVSYERSMRTSLLELPLFGFTSNQVDIGLGPQLQYAHPIGKRFTVNLNAFSQAMLRSSTLYMVFRDTNTGYESHLLATSDILRINVSLTASVRFDVLKNAGVEITFADFHYDYIPQAPIHGNFFDYTYKPNSWLFGAYLRF